MNIWKNAFRLSILLPSQQSINQEPILIFYYRWLPGNLPHTMAATPTDMSAPKLFRPWQMLRMNRMIRARMTSSANMVKVIITCMDRNQARNKTENQSNVATHHWSTKPYWYILAVNQLLFYDWPEINWSTCIVSFLQPKCKISENYIYIPRHLRFG